MRFLPCLADLSFCALTCACAASPASAPDSTSDSGTDTSTVVPTPEVIVGGANPDGTGFVDWSSGTERPHIITGIQGGQHVFVSIRTRNLYPVQTQIVATVAQPVSCTPFAPGPSTWKVSLKKDGDWLGYQGITAFVDQPCSVRDQPVHVKVDVTDKDGVKAHGEATIRPVWDGSCP